MILKDELLRIVKEYPNCVYSLSMVINSMSLGYRDCLMTCYENIEDMINFYKSLGFGVVIEDGQEYKWSNKLIRIIW